MPEKSKLKKWWESLGVDKQKKILEKELLGTPLTEVELNTIYIFYNKTSNDRNNPK